MRASSAPVHAAACGVLLGASLLLGQQRGSIAGRVLTNEGRTVGGALVVCHLAGQPAMGRPDASARTDVTGRYRLENVPAGTLKVYASKPEEGYPDTQYDFYTTDATRPPEVVIKPGQQVEGIDIIVGPKSGKLVGQVVDSATGQPVAGARLKLVRQDHSRGQFSESANPEGKFEVLVPDRPFRLIVNLQGFNEWTSNTEGAETGLALTVPPGGIRELRVALERAR